MLPLFLLLQVTKCIFSQRHDKHSVLLLFVCSTCSPDEFGNDSHLILSLHFSPSLASKIEWLLTVFRIKSKVLKMADKTLEGLAIACKVGYTSLLSVCPALGLFALKMFSLTFVLYPVKCDSSFRSQSCSPHPQPTASEKPSHFSKSHQILHYMLSWCHVYLYPVCQFYFDISLCCYLMKAETHGFLHNKAKETI